MFFKLANKENWSMKNLSSSIRHLPNLFVFDEEYIILYLFDKFEENCNKMEITTYTDFRRNMKSYFEKVFNMRAPLFISRPKGHDMVLISKSEYTSMQETFHLLKSPRNAARLLAALEQDKKGGGTTQELLD